MCPVGPPTSRARTLQTADLIPQFKAIRNNVLSFLLVLSKKMRLGSRCFEKAARMLDQFLLRRPNSWSKSYFYSAICLQLSSKLNQKDSKVASLQQLRDQSSLSQVQIEQFRQAQRQLLYVLDYNPNYQTIHDWLHYFLGSGRLHQTQKDQICERLTFSGLQNPMAVAWNAYGYVGMFLGTEFQCPATLIGDLAQQLNVKLDQQQLRQIKSVVSSACVTVLRQRCVNTIRSLSRGCKGKREDNYQQKMPNQLMAPCRTAHKSGERVLGGNHNFQRGRQFQNVTYRYDFIKNRLRY